MAPKRNLSLKFRVIRNIVSVFLQMFGVRKGPNLRLAKKLKKNDCEAQPFGKPCFETEGIHGAGDDEAAEGLLEGEEEDDPDEDLDVLTNDNNSLADINTREEATKAQSKTLNDQLVEKHNAAKTTSLSTINGNIYRGLAFGLYDGCDFQSIVLKVGAFVIFLVQLLAPMFLLAFQIVTIDWPTFYDGSSATKSEDFVCESTTKIVGYITEGLGGLFFTAICIWAFNTVGSEHDDWTKVYFCWGISKNRVTCCCPMYQLIGSFMNIYVLVMNVVITGLMFVTTDNPVDLVMNALALQFLVQLDDFGGGFDFIPELWDPALVGEVFNGLACAYALGDCDLQRDLWDKLGKPQVEMMGEDETLPTDGGIRDLFDHFMEPTEETTNDKSAEELTMEYALKESHWSKYPSYWATLMMAYLAKALIFLALVGYFVLNSQGVQKKQTGMERKLDGLTDAIKNCTHEVCKVLQMQLEGADNAC